MSGGGRDGRPSVVRSTAGTSARCALAPTDGKPVSWRATTRASANPSQELIPEIPPSCPDRLGVEAMVLPANGSDSRSWSSCVSWVWHRCRNLRRESGCAEQVVERQEREAVREAEGQGHVDAACCQDRRLARCLEARRRAEQLTPRRPCGTDQCRSDLASRETPGLR